MRAISCEWVAVNSTERKDSAKQGFPNASVRNCTDCGSLRRYPAKILRSIPRRTMKRFRSTSNLYFKLRSRSPSDKRACNFCIDDSSRSRQILQMWTELLPSSDSPDTPRDKSLSSQHLFLQFVMTQLLAALRSGGITNHLCREPFDRNVS